MTPAEIKSLRDIADANRRAARIAFHEMRVATLRHGADSHESLVSYRAWRRALEASDGSLTRLTNAEYAHPAAAHLSLADGEELTRLPDEPRSTYNARRARAARLANA
jgi:hypothetical protein